MYEGCQKHVAHNNIEHGFKEFLCKHFRVIILNSLCENSSEPLGVQTELYEICISVKIKVPSLCLYSTCTYCNLDSIHILSSQSYLLGNECLKCVHIASTVNINSQHLCNFCLCSYIISSCILLCILDKGTKFISILRMKCIIIVTTNV